VQQQVERPLEDRSGNVDCHGCEANRRGRFGTPFSTECTLVGGVVTVSLSP